MFYKVIIEKIQIIEAESADEAEEKAFYEDFISEEERIVDVKKTTIDN